MTSGSPSLLPRLLSPFLLLSPVDCRPSWTSNVEYRPERKRRVNKHQLRIMWSQHRSGYHFTLSHWMEGLHRSSRNSVKVHYGDSLSPSYPENPPQNLFEQRISSLALSIVTSSHSIDFTFVSTFSTHKVFLWSAHGNAVSDAHEWTGFRGAIMGMANSHVHKIYLLRYGLRHHYRHICILKAISMRVNSTTKKLINNQTPYDDWPHPHARMLIAQIFKKREWRSWHGSSFIWTGSSFSDPNDRRLRRW